MPGRFDRDGDEPVPRAWLMRLACCVVLAGLLPIVLALTPAALAQDGPEALAGAFAVTIADEDVPLDLRDRATVVGRWEIAFADGAWTLTRQDVGELANGRYDLDGDRLTLEERGGVLACTAPGVYRWRLDGDRLVLAAIEEPCAHRRLLLTTRVLVASLPCPPLAGSARATPPAGGEGTPQPSIDAEATIDDLLTRMSACWATRDPARFLALTSDAYRATVADGGPDAYRRFAIAMAVPIVWDRVEPVVLTDEAHANAIVRQTSGDHQDYGRYAFVFEDDAWRWDGVFGEP